MIPRAARRALHSLPVALLAACFGLGIAPLSARPRPNPAPTGEHVSERQLPVAERVTTHVRRHLDDAKARLRRSEFGPAFQAWVRAFELRPSPDVGAFLVKWSQTEAPGLRPPYFESLDREQRRQLLAMIGAHHPGRLRLLGWLDPAPTDRPPVVTARRFCSSSLDSATCLRWLARVELSERSLRWLIRERRVRVASLWSAASRSARSGRLALAIRFYGWLARVDSESSSRALNRIGEIRLRQNRFRDARRLFLASIAEGVGRMPWPPAETALSRLVSLLPLTDVPRRAVELLLRVDSDHAFNRIYDLAGRFQHLGGRSGATFCLDFLVRRSRDVLVRAYALVDRLKLETTFAAFARLARVELPQLWRDAQREQKPNGGQLVLRRVVLRLLRHAASRPAPNHREIADGLSLIDVIESLQPPVRRSEMAILAALSASYRIARGECRKARLRLTWLKRQSWLRELPTRIGSVSRTRLVGLFVGDSRCGRERGALRQLVRGAIR